MEGYSTLKISHDYKFIHMCTTLQQSKTANKSAAVIQLLHNQEPTMYTKQQRTSIALKA